MKTISKILVTLFVFVLMAGFCEAAETINNEEELGKVKRLAIYYPDYFHYEEYKDEPPDTDSFLKVLFDASKSSRSYVISYDEIAEKIKADSGIDIKVLSKMEARKVFKEHIYKYADAYLFVCLANNSRVNMFFDVYAVNTNELLYSFQLAGGKNNYDKSVKSYQTIADQFYKAFDKAAQDAAKKQGKDKKDNKKSK